MAVKNKSNHSRKGITFQYIKNSAKIDLKKDKIRKKLFEQIKKR